jgi:hypothetical protein
MSFSSNKNKELLWNTLIEVGAFNNIKEEKLTMVKTKFNDIHTSLQHNEKQINLLDLNKQFTLSMVQYLNTLKNKPIINEVYNSKQVSNTSELKLQYQNNLDKKKPNKVSFEDEKDEPIKNIDELLLKMQKDRNIELPTNQDIKKAEKWINNSGDNKVLDNTVGDNKVLNNTVGDNTVGDNTVQDDQTSIFLNKLKKNTPPLSLEERISKLEIAIETINKRLDFNTK